ncbi:MAG: Sensor histidine kinase RcsC [Chroococcopsis gigantea SAG 12.99]|nr:Sensor histidine kinase RcsC [Chroococcopsis gigantea SAG 12.99]
MKTMPLLILVADDDPGIRLAVKDFLELAGYAVITAGNGLEALGLLESYHPHLLVSDIRMPKATGYELVLKVRQRPEFRLLPVIFLTERSSTEERIKGYQVGCDAYLPKPFEMEELKAVIRNLLERAQIVQSEWLYKQQKGSHSSSHSFTELETRQSLSPTEDVHLTERELEVLNLISQGLSNVEIGNKLHLSPRTIEKRVSSLLRKTLTNNRAELVKFSIDHRLID